MTTLEKLHHDIALDADLPLDQQLASLTSDAVALATRLDAVLRVIKREDITYGAASEIRAILEAGQ